MVSMIDGQILFVNASTLKKILRMSRRDPVYRRSLKKMIIRKAEASVKGERYSGVVCLTLIEKKRGGPMLWIKWG